MLRLKTSREYYFERMHNALKAEHVAINTKRNLRVFKPGDLVMVKIPLGEGMSKKLNSKFIGPWRIQNMINEVFILNHYELKKMW